jgi:HSP20 family protein
MSITHDPLQGLRFFEDAVTRLMSEPRGSRPWSPAVDIVETENELVLKADLPDVKLEDIIVHVENQTLTVKGERKFEKDENARGYHRIERSYGNFVRSFAVPSTVDTEKEGRSQAPADQDHAISCQPRRLPSAVDQKIDRRMVC